MKSIVSNILMNLILKLRPGIYSSIFGSIWIKEDKNISSRLVRKLSQSILNHCRSDYKIRFNEKLWSSAAGEKWHHRIDEQIQSNHHRAFETRFALVDDIIQALGKQSYDYVIEIGTGNGTLIFEAYKKAEASLGINEQWIGHDLNANVINANSAKKEYSGIKFSDANILNVLKTSSKALIFCTATFTCFDKISMNNFIDIFSSLKSGSTVVFLEPAVFDNEDKPTFYERSAIAFSHPYYDLFSRSSLTIQTLERLPSDKEFVKGIIVKS